MLNVVDKGIGNITAVLHAENMWDNTLVSAPNVVRCVPRTNVAHNALHNAADSERGLG